MTGAPEGFARRWSRLKRQPEPMPPAEPHETAEAPLIEIPPPAETIPLSDITAWLGKRLPDGWREVALRRLWSSDTAIRDFVGPADYAWDWNTPGGAPGWGPMRAADDLARLLARAIGEDLPPPEPPAEAARPELVAIAEPAPIPPDIAIELPPEIVPEPAPEPPSTPIARRGGRAAPV